MMTMTSKRPLPIGFRLAAPTLLFVPILAMAPVAATGCERAPTEDLGYRPGSLNQRPTSRAAFAGTWIGEAEDPFSVDGAYHFPSGSTQILLELTASPPSQAIGVDASHVTFGAGQTPLPATDPNVGYPSDPHFNFGAEAAFDTSITPPTEGFRYELTAGIAGREFDAYYAENPDRSAETDGHCGQLVCDATEAFLDEGLILDGRVDLSFFPNELVESWCALQTAATCPANQGGGVDPTTGACYVGTSPSLGTMDCQKVSMCSLRSLCSCPATGACEASRDRGARLTLGVEGDGLVGLFSGAVFVNARGYQQPLGTVHFHRAP